MNERDNNPFWLMTSVVQVVQLKTKQPQMGRPGIISKLCHFRRVLL